MTLTSRSADERRSLDFILSLYLDHLDLYLLSLSMISIPAGAIVLCEKDHEVLVVTQNIHKGSTGYHEKLRWREGQVVAQKGDQLPLRCYCGAKYTTSGMCVTFPSFKWFK